MENLELEFKLTVAHVNTILKHLGAGVAELNDLIQFLHGQAKPQIEAAVPPAPVEAASEEQPAQ